MATAVATATIIAGCFTGMAASQSWCSRIHLITLSITRAGDAFTGNRQVPLMVSLAN